MTGEAPLIDTTSSNIASNIDPRQMQDLPLNGRNWMDLTLLSPGSRTNSATEIPYDRQGYFQVNVDGQQVTFTLCCQQNQPRFSRDSIAEFELTTNRFDATKGRTAGMMVNAITKSGTNTPSGTFSGFCPRRLDERQGPHPEPRASVLQPELQRHVRRADHPRSDPLFREQGVRDASRARSRSAAAYPSFNPDLTAKRTEHKAGPKVDWQFTPQMRLTHALQPLPDEDSEHRRPAARATTRRPAARRARCQPVVRRLQPGAQREEPEPRVGRLGLPPLPAGTQRRVGDHGEPARRRARRHSSATSSAARRSTAASSVLAFSGYNFGNTNNPQSSGEKVYNLRDDFTTSFNAGRPARRQDGRRIHPLHDGHGVVQQLQRAGSGSTSRRRRTSSSSSRCGTTRPPGTCARCRRWWCDYRMAIGDFAWAIQRNIWAGWLQDDWAVSNHLTLNLGVRYDTDLGGHGEADRVRAVDVGQAAARREQHRAANRVRLCRERPHGDPRRLRVVLHAARGGCRASVAAADRARVR